MPNDYDPQLVASDPPLTAPEPASVASEPSLVAAEPLPAAKEGTLIISAFLGRGNAGDEAMLQVLFEAFSPRFNIAVSVDQLGAYPGFETWYPYPQTNIFHQNNCNVAEQIADPAGFLVGGGALSLGFGANQALVARACRVPTALAGVDIWQPSPNPASPQREALRTWLDLFDEIIPRTVRSVTGVQSLGLEPLHGADFALRLVTDESPDIRPNPRRALVVLREGLMDMASEEYAAWAINLMKQLVLSDYRPVLLPFSPEDDRLITELDLRDRFEVECVWWNPRRLKQLMACSALTLTVGRLHPMIFAAPTGRNIAVLRPPQWTGKRAIAMRKITYMSEELGIDVFDTAESFIAALQEGRVRPADPVRVQAALGRVDTALERLHALFRCHKTYRSADGDAAATGGPAAEMQPSSSVPADAPEEAAEEFQPISAPDMADLPAHALAGQAVNGESRGILRRVLSRPGWP